MLKISPMCFRPDPLCKLLMNLKFLADIRIFFMHFFTTMKNTCICICIHVRKKNIQFSHSQLIITVIREEKLRDPRGGRVRLQWFPTAASRHTGMSRGSLRCVAKLCDRHLKTRTINVHISRFHVLLICLGGRNSVYLTKIFGQLNIVNSSMQGRNENILTSTDK